MNQYDLDKLLFAALRNLKIKAGGDVYFDPGVERAMEKARRKKPGNQDAMDAGMILSIRRAHEDDFCIAVRDIPSPYEPPQRSEALYYAIRAGSHEITDKIDEAIADYTKLLELDSGSTWALGCRGRLYLDKGDFEAARRDLERRAELETIPDNKPLAQNALNELTSLENCEDILDVEFDSVEAEARQHWYHARHTTAGEGAGRRECLRGLDILDTAIQLAGGRFPRAHTLKAQIYLKLDNIDKAVDEACTALEESPNEFGSLALLAMLAVANCPASPDAPKQGFGEELAGTINNNTARDIITTMSQENQRRKAENQWRDTVREHFGYIVDMVDLFTKLCTHGINADNFVRFSETMMDVQDMLDEKGLPFPPEMIPQAIADVPDSKMFFANEEELNAVEEIRQIARGALAQ